MTRSSPSRCTTLAGTRWRASIEVSDQLQNEIAHFFSIYKNLENKHVEVKGWFSRQDAVDEIEGVRGRVSRTQRAH